ncbi:MAG TPA: molybdopterin cofactor-binding domain-containing protein [Acidimicrobiales bacterium]|nr:molybdopterin cofactor-binding domain-containing protein [Acidimicrobiales bacterium]
MTATETPAEADAEAPAPTVGGIGDRLLRKEDARLLTGEARFVDDLQVPGALWMALVRSPFAHARITGIDVGGAQALPGVRHVFTGADLRDAWANPMPCAWPVTDDMKSPDHWPVAVDKACFAGDAVAVVVADSRSAAIDAVEAVVVDYEPLDVVLDLETAATDGTVLHEALGTNRSFTWTLSPDPDAVEQAFADAVHVVSERYVHQRLIPAAMEPRGVVAVPGPYGGEMTVYSSTQIPHILKVMITLTCGVPESKVRVIAPAVGGGFGSKLEVYAEEFLAVALARRLGLPVRWTETRSEAGVATIHGRGLVQHMELAADAQGKVQAVRAKLLSDMGAYLQLVTPGIPILGAFLYHGVYDVPAYHFECTGIFTNRTPTDAYRGAGRPEATYAVERAMDALAAEVGVDAVEIRRRNYIAPDKFPYASSGGLTYDSGNYEPTLDRALELIGHDALRVEQQRRRDAGETVHLGVGIATYVEMCGLAPSRVLASLKYAAGGWEAATVRVLPTGSVQVVSGTTPHGQGHETSWSQIVADRLGVDPALVEVLHSDTAVSPMGMDTYGSRSLPVGGVAVAMATDEVIAKARRIAAHQLECAEDDLELVGGELQVRGTPTRAMTLQAVAFEAFSAHDLPDDMEPNLQGQVTYDPPNFVFPFGTHIAVVEVDEETGLVRLVDYAAVDDCGVQINPMIVEGQVHGGIVQGAAQALWEEAVYDDDGTLQNPTLLDYCVPSAAEVPNFRLDHTVTPSPTNPLGVKGIGEAGTIAATPTVVNAVVDALSHLGVRDIQMPATPERVWSTIQQARQGEEDRS